MSSASGFTAAYLVTQWKSDARLLSGLLEASVRAQVRTRTDEVWSGAVAQARACILEGIPVALVLDAGSRKPRCIERHRDFLRFALGMTGPEFMWKVLLLKPQVPRLYFREPGVLRQLVGREPSAEQLSRARAEPRAVLAELLEVAPGGLDAALCARLEGVELGPLLRFPSVQRLRRFLQAHTDLRSPPPGLR